MKKLELAQTATEARAVRLLRALANPTRFRLIELLADRKEATAPQLAEALALAQSSLFDHLAALREAGLVQASGEVQGRYYCLDPSTLDFLVAYLTGLGQRARSWSGLIEGARRGGDGGSGMEIREATVGDAATIATIYNQGIEDRIATLETLPRSAEERGAWLATRGPRHPVLVAVDREASGDGAIVGWGALNPFNPRPAYDHVVDFSLYVAREQRGRGIGDALLGALVTRARALGYHKIVLAALPINAPGMRLYERHDFRTVGIYREQGLLDGRWVDVIVMERLLG